MKLRSDKQGRIASREFFPPQSAFDVSRMADGSVRLVESVKKDVPLVKTRKEGGFVLVNVKPDRAAIQSAIRADRDR